jgi:hypothetical protein
MYAVYSKMNYALKFQLCAKKENSAIYIPNIWN